MSGTTISTTIAGGITLGSGTYISPLTITSTGAVHHDITQFGGGLYIPGGLTGYIIEDDGSIGAGTGAGGAAGITGSNGGGNVPGGTGGAGDSGFDGGLALVANAYGTLIVAGQITGGIGGVGGTGGTGGTGGLSTITTTHEPGGAGGIGGVGGQGQVGVYFAAGGSMTNSGTVAGGAGGTGGTGGLGGLGQEVINPALTFGGPGGKGGSGGAGGLGGSGVVLYGANASLTNTGALIGGTGGAGGLGGQGGNGGYSGNGSLAIGIFGQVGGGGNGGTGGQGGFGAYLFNGTLTNYGLILGGGGGVAGGGGAVGQLGGTGSNSAGSAGSLGAGGAGAVFAGGSLLNTGTIEGGAGGTGGAGVYFQLSGMVNNTGIILGGAGTALGGAGVYLDGGTLINAGTIAGGLGQGSLQAEAVSFGNITSTLVDEAGALFTGNVVAVSTAGDVLELDGNSGVLFQGLNGQFLNFSTLAFATGALRNVEINHAYISNTLAITGFALGDSIVLGGITESSASFGAAGLVINDTTTLDITGAFTTADFNFTNSAGNTTISLNATCFCPGTRIATPRGETPVEALAIGDIVRTQFGEAPVKWIGKRSYDGRFIAGNHLVLPVTLRAGALGPGQPAHNLTLSPGHALFVDGALIPAWRLINGVSITQAEAAERVDYLHVELEGHDIIFAEGCAVETYLAGEDRAQFHNAAEFWRLYPDDTPALPLLPRCEDGFALDATRRRLAARAGLTLPSGSGEVRGFVDIAGPAHCAGWAQFRDTPEAPVALDVFSGGRRIARLLANSYRADLRAAGLGSGCHAFSLPLPDGTTALEVRVAACGTPLALTEAARAA